MEPAEIIKACMERGILVSSEDLKRMEAGLELDKFIASKQQPQAQPQEEPKTGKTTYRARRAKPKDTMTPGDLMEQYKNRYEAIKGMLLSKTSAISIGNARDSAASVSLIGMVKQLIESGFVLEDVTGEIEVVCDGSRPIEEDDVICVRGPVKNGRMFCKDMIYPDVPLLRPIGRIESTLLLLPKPGKPAATADMVLSTEPVETGAKNIVLDSSPSHLSIYKDGKVNVLFYKTGNGTSQQDAINMLKKRLLKKPGGLLVDGDAFLIEPVPDIFWVSGKGQDWIETYKGVTIVHTPDSSEKQVLIDLKTREAKLI
jgi:hypothetical protein